MSYKNNWNIKLFNLKSMNELTIQDADDINKMGIIILNEL